MKLVVGLGNPGDRYRDTRHNIGFDVLDEVSRGSMASAWSSRFDGLVTDCRIDGEKTVLLKPATFMNRSGQAVRKAIDFHKAEPEDLLVVCDDFNLAIGRLRLRRGGSSGGQNGLKDIARHLGGDEFPRLRVGIGSPPDRMDPADFVLSRFSSAERSSVSEAVVEAARAVEWWVRHGIASAMNEFNGSKSKE